MVYLFFLVYFVLLLSVIFLRKAKFVNSFFVLSGMLLFLIAGFRSDDVTNDYTGYVDYYNAVINDSFSRVEPSFIYISKLVDNLFHNVLFLFVIYAFLGVYFKYIAIRNLSHFKLHSVFIYFCSFFLILEMTQIRAGVAAGLVLLCIKPIKERKIWLFLFFSLLAFFFHFSALIILFFYFLNSKEINKKVYFALIPLGYIMYFSKINLFFFLDFLKIDLIQMKFESYSTYDNDINLFNYVYLSRILLASFLLWKIKLIKEKNEYAILLIKIYFISLFVFSAFASIPGISTRMSELLLIVEIILTPCLLYVFRNRGVANFFIFIIGLVHLCFSIFVTKLLL
ncbi:EpsG family protein [Chryseobacterium gwangjuense]|uniref:EpsG family protein n=1 Tax=Chryseobacterium gwangjuense TaxID=1069980 RepID=UPI001E4C4543|nr:EpsG family protein [Chryseobacterium gwangjuense]MCE3076899.1 EpsG family protein [Chryseobacterium gwangjuense]